MSIVKETVMEVDQAVSASVRPRKLLDYIGQNQVKSQMSVFIQAAKARGQSLDHTLLCGPPGLGKTTLAHIVANELSAQLIQATGPGMDKVGDLAAILTNLQKGDVLFIDEIHRMNASVEETLYSAMEDYKLDIIIGEGSSARTITLDLPPFTLIGATTRSGLLSAPFRDRFGINLRLQYYDYEELTDIITRSAGILDVQISGLAAQSIANRSRGTPRIANKLLRRVRDFHQVSSSELEIGQVSADKALELLGIDEHGLDDMDRKLLAIISEHFNGGPVGLESLAASLGEEKGTIEEVLEPFLIQSGILVRTPRGRALTAKGSKIAGLTTVSY
ncbi:Holliday junction branch migration DNA helicase RuvB [Candidatus Comchoanobacter bicostacola]|uniref:Holliday junction branch migration complex subunit RuvB n=1 Tax=Candidatus Comchoanobacter bicostacola TaxID=2919598 RepID=A0ABY5DIM1_9GAMM|nr:Holliday junction branch migration DNA helicase RuvB [Candidatus Comchoanobacter bicostacola]UTC24438.1 Holliday junction branch migration DNA helicase RuvB [Candidatus Comchoanobacter bicostacola]